AGSAGSKESGGGNQINRRCETTFPELTGILPSRQCEDQCRPDGKDPSAGDNQQKTEYNDHRPAGCAFSQHSDLFLLPLSCRRTCGCGCRNPGWLCAVLLCQNPARAFR